MDRSNRPWLGAFLIVLGVAFLLRNFGLIPDFVFHIFHWPNFMFLIAIGLLLAGNQKGALVITCIGVFFLLQSWLGWQLAWPLILIGVGVMIFLRQSGRLNFPDSSSGEGTPSSGSINETVIFSGSQRNFAHQEFKGGKITTIFGGTELDLRDSNLEEGAILDLFCMFGGIEIKAPEHWVIDLQVNPVFGGSSDERKTADPAGPTLVIKGFVMFGGIEIKS